MMFGRRLGFLAKGCRPDIYVTLHPNLQSERAAKPTTAFAAKNSQRNDGLYFEYERVDPEAAKELPLEQERVKEEFDWVQQARQAARTHRTRREDDGSSSPGGRRGRGGGRGQGQGKRPPPVMTARNAPPAALAHAAAAPSPSREASPAVPEVAPAAVARATSSEDRLKPEDTGGTSTGPSLGGRKARLLQRMQGEGGSRSGQPTQEERTSRGLSTAAARPSVELVEEAPVVKLRQLPSVPDLGNLDEEEAQIKAMLQGTFVDALEGPRTHQEGDLEVSGSLLDAESGGLSGAVGRESAAQREYANWVDQLKRRKDASGQGSSDALDKTAFTDTLTALLADPALDEAGKGAGGSSEAAPGDSIPDVAGYLRTATRDLSDLRSLSALLADNDMLLSSLGDGDMPEEGSMSDEKVMELLRKSDPELYELLSSVPGSQEDVEMLNLFSGSDDSALLAGGSDDVTDAELAEMLKFGKETDNFLEDDGDEEEDGEAELGDLFEAIDDDDDLDEADKMRAMYSLQGIFNAPAEEVTARGKKDAEQTESSSRQKGPATTTRGANNPDEPPPAMLSRPKLRP